MHRQLQCRLYLAETVIISFFPSLSLNLFWNIHSHTNGFEKVFSIIFVILDGVSEYDFFAFMHSVSQCIIDAELPNEIFFMRTQQNIELS